MPPKVTSKSITVAADGGEDLQKYQKMTDIEHILKKPDTYIGTIEPTDTMEYIMDDVGEELPHPHLHPHLHPHPHPHLPVATSPTSPDSTNCSMKAW